jgi:hypothetical protein
VCCVTSCIDSLREDFFAERLLCVKNGLVALSKTMCKFASLLMGGRGALALTAGMSVGWDLGKELPTKELHCLLQKILLDQALRWRP